MNKFWLFIISTVLLSDISFSQEATKVDNYLRMLSAQRNEKSIYRRKEKKDKNGETMVPISLPKELFETFFGVDKSQSNPKIHALIKLKDPKRFNHSESVKINSKFGEFATAEFNISELDALAANDAVDFIEMGKPLKLLLDASSQKVNASQGRTSFNKTGSGVIVGIMDTGIDFTHDDFRKADGTSRIEYIWDQYLTPASGESSPSSTYSYGVEYSKTNINSALSSSGTVRSQDFSGHGTHVAGIAAGNGRATGNGQPAGTYVGMAPDAGLIVTKVKTTNFANLIDALVWCGSKANSLNKPWVTNISLGTTFGPRDGTSLFDQAIFGVTNQSDLGKGRIIVVSAGNEGYNASDPNKNPLDKEHASGSGTSAQIKTLVVNSSTLSTFNKELVTLELWYPQYDNYQITLKDPDGTTWGPYSKGSGTGNPGYGYLTNSGFVYVQNHHYDASYPKYYVTTNDNLIEISISDYNYNGTQYNLKPGNWTITVQGISGSTGRWDVYRAQEFSYNGIYFDDASYENARVLTEPATAKNVITTGSFNSKNSWTNVSNNTTSLSGYTVDAISYFSSPGPTRDGRNKPDIYAPGAWVASSLSKDAYSSGYNNYIARDGKHIHLNGTSMAAPHVAGAVALLLQQNNNYTYSDVKSILDQSKTASGYLNIYAALSVNAGTVGVEDDIDITTGTTLVYQNSSASYSAQFYDYAPTGDYIVGSWTWDFVLLHDQGEYTYASGTSWGSSSTSWSPSTGTVPSGYNWIRDANGNVTGKVKVSAVDNDSHFHYDEMTVGIRMVPEKPVIYERSPGTSKIGLSFVSSGATGYKIYYGTSSGSPYNGTGATEGNSPIDVGSNKSMVLHGLQNNTVYYLAVKGYNAVGESDYSEELPCTPITTSGTFSANETWSSSTNPQTIVIEGNVTIPSGKSLTIQAGSILEFASSASLTAYGTLTVNGTTLLPVTFISQTSTTPGSWGSIILDGASASGSALNYVIAKYGTEIKANNVPSFTINNSTIESMVNGVNAYNSNGWVTNSKIVNPRDHGIISNASTIACYQNSITKTDYSGAGILYTGGGGDYIWDNDISGFNWGVGASWGASAYCGYTSNTGNNNSITNCLIGANVYQSGYAMFGEFDGDKYNRYYTGNFIGSNSYLDVQVYTNSTVYAQGTTWGNGSPAYSVYDNSYFIFEEYEELAQPPVQNIPKNVSAGKNIDFRENLEKNIAFQNIRTSSNAINGDHGILHYIKLMRNYNESTSDNILNTFLSLPETAPQETKLFLSNIYLKRGELKKAKQTNSELAKANPNSAIGSRAKLNNFYITLYNENNDKIASTLLNEIEANSKFIEPMELALAWHDLNTRKEVTKNVKNRSLNKQTELIVSSHPQEYELLQNYPNPFNPSTTIYYALPKSGNIILRVYDILGKEVITLENSYKEAGRYALKFNASNLSSGMYIYKLTADKFSEVKRMMLVK